MSSTMMKNVSILFVAGLIAITANVQAAPRENNASNKMVAKLQAMVKDATAERDAAKAEKDKLTLEIEQLKKEKSVSASAENRLGSELAAQKSNNAEVHNKLDQTHAKLLEVIEKYKALVKEKNELTTTHVSLQDTHKQTEIELQSCESKNIKMFEASKELLVKYEDKGIMDSLLKSEPVLQFKSVEMETVIQEYEDKLAKQKYQHKDIAVTKNTSQVTDQPEETQQQ